MDQETRDRIVQQRYLYRGTNDFHFGERKKDSHYYGFRKNGLVTSTSIVLLNAMVAGIQRCEGGFYQQNNSKPILLAIETLNYLDSMDFGLEGGEIEISGWINYSDITVIDSLYKLIEICPRATRHDIYMFKRSYLSEPTS